MASTPYKHFVPPVPLNPDYDKNFTYVLIETLDQLKDSFQKGVVIAWDTETTGLNPVESEIVGFSYSYDGQTGYYCPVKHFDLALGKPALDLFYQALKDAKLQLLYNARFDIRMMEYSGYDMSFLYPKNPDTNLSQAVFIDVMNQVWLADTNIPLPSLKSSTLHFLGYQPPKFLETLGDEQNFKYVPAKDAYRYACFTADTLIQTKHGLKQISELKPNVDLIKTSDGYRRLLNVLDQGVQKVIRVTTPIGISFTCTPDHKFAMEIDHCICWVEAKDLDKISFHKRYCGGQSLYGIEKSYTPSPMVMDDENACKIEYLDESQHVYDLTIDEEHNFFLQCGLIAHNCLDAINTMNLFKVTYRFYKESGKAAQLDNACVYIIGQLEKTPLNINTDYLVDLRDKVYSRVLELEQEIYSIAGHPFKIGSNRELTLVFQEQGIDTGERTKAGDMKTGIELLNMYLRNHPECTLLKLLIEYKEQFKFYNSYLKTLVDIAKKQDTVPPRFSYKLQSVPCLTENNLVLIRDKGITHIPEVKEQDYIWTQYGYKRVLWCNSHKTEDVYRVTFENAVFIEGTAHHPVLVNKGTEINPELEWATLESLKEGERVIFNHHTPPLQYSDDPKEKELSKYLEYLGYLIAVNIEPSVQYQVDWIETRDDLFKQASEEFRQMTHTIMSNPGYLFDLVIKSKPYQWIHFLQGIFFSVFETPVAQTWNNSMMDEFILRSQTPLLLTFLMNILSYLGIPTSLAYDDDSFFIIFNTSQSLTLLKTLIITDSNSHYLKSLFQNYNPFNYFIEYADSKVKAKEKMEGEHTVYDIEVEDVHEYVANGIVTHNTGRLATGKDGKNTYFAPINLQCLEENTLIKTERGNIPIKKVTEKDLVWTGTRFVPCKPLGSKQKECFKIKTLWGEIEASLEHRFLTLNIYDDYKIEWHTLAECISRKLPLVKDPQSLGIQFDDLYNHPTYSVIGNLRKELDLDRYRKVAEFYKSYKFDIIIECPWQFWKPDLYPFPELTRTVYDLYVPEYNQFTANGFIVHNSLPKPKSIKCYARKATPEEIENKQDVLGWMFSPDHPEWSPGKVVEGMDQHLNVRAAFLPEHPENGDYVVSCDMCLEAGSPVQTKRGYLGISELKVGDEIYSPQGWVEVIRVMQTSIKKLIKVLPDNGGQALYCTEDHHFPIDGKKIEARDIKTSLPSIPFYSYNEEIEKRDLTETKLSMLKMCKTPKEKANYIIANDLKDFFISSIQKYTRANIARWTGTKVSSFGHILDYLGIHKTNKRYAFKVDLFYNNPFIDSSNPTSAYLFGYILGDGNIHERKNGTSTLNITSKDKAHLTRIIEIFGKDTKMRKHSRDDKEWWSIDITDQGICKRLKELGISMRKSTEPSYVDFTWIGDNFRHFIRGLFDSDGYVRVTSCLDLSFVGHDSYIKEIQKRIDGDWGYKYTQSLSYLFLHGRLEQKKFIHAYLYQGATIWLQRKRDIIEQWYLEHFGDIIWPVWNCTVNTPEHLYYANAISTSNCGEELRVVTNLFKEESWARIINSGGDLHHANSDAIYGEENYTKETRKKAKGAAFGMLYGQEYRGFQRKFPDMSLDEAKEFMIKFKRTIPHIVHGQDRMIKDARRTGTFYSGFGRPRRVKHYLTSPDYKDVAFGERTCYSPDTEFLTKDGWKLAKNIKVDTLIAYYDPETKNTKFTEAGERITSISTESIQYLGSSYAWNVTPNHRMWIRGTSKERFRFVEAEYLLSITSCQAVGASYLDNSLEEDSDIETPIGVYNREDVAELFGWLLTDGSISKKLDTISIGQTKSANFKRLETLVSKFHGHVSYRKPSNLKEKTVLICRICNKAFSRWVIEQLQGRLKVDRHIPEWIFLSDIKVREKFIEAMLLGDGRIRKDKLSGSFDTPSKSIADRFQIILNLSGYRSIVRSYKNRNSTQMYAVTYCRKEYTNMDFRKRKNGVSNLQKVEHEPLEYSCFTVPTSILITRYKGKISYMGNCKNGPIQSTAADVLKLELVRLWDNLFTVYPEYKFIVTIHDEIDVSIPRHLANEIIPKMIRCMTVQRPSDLVPLDCSLSCGPSLGAQYEMVYNFDTKEFEPKWEEDKRIETQENTLEETENNEVDEEKDEIEDSISYEDDLVEEIDSKMFDF